jgi:hypothetical protein
MLADDVCFQNTGTAYDHLIPDIIPYPKSLKFVIRHDSVISPVDHIFWHLRPREFWINTLHPNSRLLVRKTANEARQRSFRRTIWTPSVVRNTVVACGSHKDYFAIARIERVVHSGGAQVRKR